MLIFSDIYIYIFVVLFFNRDIIVIFFEDRVKFNF